MIISCTDIPVLRPEPISSRIDFISFTQNSDSRKAIKALKDGFYVLISDYYGTGLTLLNDLRKTLQLKRGKSFSDIRENRAQFHELSSRILVKITHNKIALEKAPTIGWLEKLYSEEETFLLSFTQVQGMNSSWQWYLKGIDIPVVSGKLHPYYGVYFPTRFEHLTLFENWLMQYRGEKKLAYDIGIGCGILSFIMTEYGFEKVIGTDLNPNAIIGTEEEIIRRSADEEIELRLGNLFAGSEEVGEIIVFNPPWLPAKKINSEIERAIYYEEGLFSEFFNEANRWLGEEGKIVILFSNLAELTDPANEHPIKKELAMGRFTKELFIQKRVESSSNKTKREQPLREKEAVELWVLRRKPG